MTPGSPPPDVTLIDRAQAHALDHRESSLIIRELVAELIYARHIVNSLAASGRVTISEWR